MSLSSFIFMVICLTFVILWIIILFIPKLKRKDTGTFMMYEDENGNLICKTVYKYEIDKIKKQVKK